jgi:drug/metabolite transporter (DMT)-like permease
MQDILNKAQKLPEKIQQRLTKATPKDWGVAAGVSFVCLMVLFWLGKSSNESAFSFTVIIYTAVLALVAQIVRDEQPHNQFAWSVVLLSVFEIVLPKAAYFYTFFLGGIVALSAIVKQQV